mmetsp:Transcript_8117/g.19622  ORF Transcript_8117/g.19622 Transcript_8117/m.19622 type:complete len:257 (+) Transcript_8117:180-950(+)|eukprot:CAMPEP_0113633974 /NCGR_PEP_ID=MMETSP0017_2-20120614/17686_1 /TAXON_ID=2856 /ORGANISM="Cylindrotheca closterium" /LENGTH=256 /DNA_ID=CAMNT_0000544645 /DNA_START=90 /DNA_END=860 /DNA_ORIENTATION=+ /assembly_acc=CAM_ASM_000147
MEGDGDIVFDEESLLLFHTAREKYALYSQDSYLSSTTATDSASASSIDENEEKYDTTTIDNDNCSSRCLSLWESYYAALLEYPLLVKSLTAFVLLGFADVIAQCFERIRDRNSEDAIMALNLYRVARFGFFGLAGAPWTHYYYAWLDTVLPPTQNPWTWTTAIKVVIDQFLQAPALLAFMIMGMALMECRGISGVKVDMENQYMEALIKNWELWIPATVVNIAFVKPDLRVLYDNLVFFFWTIFLSMLLNQAPDTP